MLNYDDIDKVFFSADGFGKFGAPDADEAWDDEARRYYIGIVGKYGLSGTEAVKEGGRTGHCHDLARCDMSQAVADAFRYSKPVLSNELCRDYLAPNSETMTYTYYQNYVKPKPDTEGRKGFAYKICGYIYEGDEPPDDFICPLCKHGAADFEPFGSAWTYPA